MPKQIHRKVEPVEPTFQKSLRASIPDVLQKEDWVEAGRVMFHRANEEEGDDMAARQMRRDATVCFALDHARSDAREQRALDAQVGEILRDRAPADERLPAYFQLLKDSPDRLAAAKERMLGRRAQ
ncbi:MAG: hypothetical protein ABH834_06550 [Candidatus Altiarchaeota archaeon]